MPSPSSSFRSPGRLPGLDTLRALAILGVMLFHLGGYLPERLFIVGQFGWMGVDLFFVLSGYLIGSQLLKPYFAGAQPSIFDFYRRRAFRILPAYFAVLLLYFAVPVWREQPGISPLWEFLTFTENLFVKIVDHRAFSHAWSLCVEEHFYLILPLLLLVMMRKPSLRKTVTLLAVIPALGIALRTWLLFHGLLRLGDDDVASAYLERIYYPTYTHLDGLVTGVSLALLKTFRPGWWAALAQRGHSLFLAGLVPIGAAVWMFQDGQGAVTGPGSWGVAIGFPVLSLGLGLLVASSISTNGLLNRFPVPGAKLIATLAFSLYLTHKAVAHLDRVYLPKLTAERGVETTLVYAVSCMVAAALLYLGIERPFMRLRDRGARVTSSAIDRQIANEPAL